jgi:hypothetical protein
MSYARCRHTSWARDPPRARRLPLATRPSFIERGVRRSGASPGSSSAASRWRTARRRWTRPTSDAPHRGGHRVASTTPSAHGGGNGVMRASLALDSVTKARFTGDNLVAASQPDSTHYRSERLSDPRSLCRRGPTFPSRRHDLPHRADGDGLLRSECPYRSWNKPCGVQDWLRLGTAIPSGPLRFACLPTLAAVYDQRRAPRREVRAAPLSEG